MRYGTGDGMRWQYFAMGKEQTGVRSPDGREKKANRTKPLLQFH